MEPAWGNIILTLVVAVIMLVVFLWNRSSRKKKTAKEHGEDDHTGEAPVSPAPVKKKDDHGGHTSWYQKFLDLVVGLLVCVVLILIVAFVAKAVFGQDSSQGTGRSTGARAVVAQSQSIPASACSVPPADAEQVTAPVGACSDAYPIPHKSYACADPGPSSGLVRVKTWREGNPEPSEWDNGVTRGNKRCFGAVGSTPVTIHVWNEPQAAP
jgi:hypothetical protein